MYINFLNFTLFQERFTLFFKWTSIYEIFFGGQWEFMFMHLLNIF